MFPDVPRGYRGYMEDGLSQNRPLARMKRSEPGAKCRRRLGLSPAGIPVLCARDAVFQMDGVDLCQDHLQEAMRVAETTPRSE
jgi:hypothetical protein